MNDEFGDRIKSFEQMEAGRRLMPLLPVCARIDGRSFSAYTKKLTKPFDKRLVDIFIDTTKWLCEETCAVCGYTESDEISLVWYSDNVKSQIFFDGKIHKMVSQLASLTTAYFNNNNNSIKELVLPLATFDARVWNMPTLEEAANALLWRNLDSYKNSVSSAARCYFSHKDLINKNCEQMQEMLFSKGINYNDYPNFFKRGTFIQKIIIKKKYTIEEIDKLPPLHKARNNPDLMVERNDYLIRNELPSFGKVKNRVGFIFYGEEAT